MWEVPEFKVKPYSKALRDKKGRNGKRQTVDAVAMRIRMVSGTLSYFDSISGLDRVMPARLVLNDLSSKKLSLFVTHQIPPGEKVHLRFSEPTLVKFSATVTQCARTEMTRQIICQNYFDARLDLQIESNDSQGEVEFGTFLQHSRKILTSTV